MCEGCGCDANDAKPLIKESHTHYHDGRIYHHAHSSAHEREHPHDEAFVARTLRVEQAILGENERLAERNRGYFKAKGLLVINLLSSPGSGKTALIERTLNDLRDRLPAGVIVGDLATDNDARRIRATGAPVEQITTGAICHLDAKMVARAAESMKLDGLRLLIIENVGNLVCPAVYDLGENLRVVLLSVSEGEDKPLKYPLIFKTAHVVVVTKTDMAVAADFKREDALANIRGVAPQAKIFELSARDGQGLMAWYEFLTKHFNFTR